MHCIHAYICIHFQMNKQKNHRRTGPFPLGWGGEGGTIFFPRISYPCPKVEYVWAMHFCRTLGGGGGGVGVLGEEENYSFEVIEYRKPQRVEVGWGPSHGGDLFGF